MSHVSCRSFPMFDVSTEKCRAIRSRSYLTSIDCTSTGVLVGTGWGDQIYSVDPRTEVTCALIGKDYNVWRRGHGGSRSEEWRMVDGCTATAQFAAPRAIVLCDDDRAACVLDDETLRYVTLPELDQSMFVQPKHFE